MTDDEAKRIKQNKFCVLGCYGCCRSINAFNNFGGYRIGLLTEQNART